MSKRKKPAPKKHTPKPARGQKNKKPAQVAPSPETIAAPGSVAADAETVAGAVPATHAEAPVEPDTVTLDADSASAAAFGDDDPDAPSPEPLGDDNPDATPSPEALGDDDPDAPSPEPLGDDADDDDGPSDLDATREQGAAKTAESDPASAAHDDPEPETPRPTKTEAEPAAVHDDADDELEFPSVPSEGRPRATGSDDDDLTTTVVWTGTSKRRSSVDLGDSDDADDDDAVVSSLGNRRRAAVPDDLEVTVNLTADLLPVQERDDLSEPTRTALPEEEDVTRTSLPAPSDDGVTVTHQHLRGLIEALVFASDRPLRAGELARRAQAPAKEIKQLLGELRALYTGRGIQLDEVGGAFVFRTNPIYAPFVRELTGQKPVKLTRTQVETLSILAYRQPITRPEIDDIRGVDSGPVLKMLLERDLIKILGKKDEPGRPILYGTTPQFLEFFGIPSLKDLPTLREFTELNDDSKRVVERELGESYESVQASLAEESIEHMATNDLGTFEPEEESDAETTTSTTRVDEALREIERASLDGDPDDDTPVVPVPLEDPADTGADDDDPALDEELSLDEDDDDDDDDDDAADEGADDDAADGSGTSPKSDAPVSDDDLDGDPESDGDLASDTEPDDESSADDDDA